MSWRKYLVIPQLVAYSLRAPRDQAAAWERFWSGVRRTGPDGEVFWDAGSEAEAARIAGHLGAAADARLPLVDLGCGNGRQARALARRDLATRVIGVDRSASAVARAREEAAGAAGGAAGEGVPVEFRVADVAEPGLGQRLHAELGDVNVHVRGVLHVVPHALVPEVARTVEALLGARGTAYLCEGDQAGDPLETLEVQGATATSMPDVLRRLLVAGVRPPSHFGAAEVARFFPPDRFRVLEQGAAVLHGIPMRPGDRVNEIPGYYALLRVAG